MRSRPVRVGVIDSGSAPEPGQSVAAAAAFVTAESGVERIAAAPDVLGHGSKVLSIIAHCAPRAQLYIAQVFRERPVTSAAQVAAALDWLVEQEVTVVNLSLGLREARDVLAAACARAVDAGVVICAASPALGRPVYPASFDGVLRVTGDARCARMEFSAIGTAQADFGAHVRPLDGDRGASGASMGCAHLSGHIGHHLADGGLPDAAAVRAWLRANARYQGAPLPGNE
jgi:hypothetical protein